MTNNTNNLLLIDKLLHILEINPILIREQIFEYAIYIVFISHIHIEDLHKLAYISLPHYPDKNVFEVRKSPDKNVQYMALLSTRLVSHRRQPS